MSQHPGPIVILVGAPGSGKTTVGQLVSDSLGVGFRDTDHDIEAQAGMSVGEIFLEEGEPGFRERERGAVAAAISEHRGVLSVGGGAVLDADTRELLAANHTVWLRVHAGRAANRVGMNAARPLLLGNVRGTLIGLLEKRAPLYAEVASATVDTDALTAAQVAQAVIAIINQEGWA